MNMFRIWFSVWIWAAVGCTSAPVNTQVVLPKAERVHAEYGAMVQLRIRKQIHYSDGLSIVLRAFSHKKPSPGGPTKASAYLALSKGSESGEVRLSIHGVDGKSTATDGLSDRQRYSGDQWGNYQFQLKSFSYGKMVEVIVRKKD